MSVQVLQPGFFLTAVDSGLLSTLQPAQTSLSWFLSSPDGTRVTGTGLVLSYSSAGEERVHQQVLIQQQIRVLTRSLPA